MKKEIIGILFIVLIGFGLSDITNYNEKFSISSDQLLKDENAEQLSINLTTTNNFFEGDLGVWYMGLPGVPETPAFGGLQLGNFWNEVNQKQMYANETNGIILQFNLNSNRWKITNLTQIEFYSNMSDVLGNVQNAIVFIQVNNSCYYISSSGGSTGFRDNYCSEVYNICEQAITSNSLIPKKYTLNMSKCSFMNNGNTIDNINRVVLRNALIVDPAGEQWISSTNYRFINIENSTQSLPNVNFTLEKSVLCVNDSTRRTEFIYNIDASDDNNDTILYFTEEKTSKNFNKTVSYNRKECLTRETFCRNAQEFGLIGTPVYPTNDTCRINLVPKTLDLEKFNVVEYIDPVFKNEFYELHMSGECNRPDNSFYYRLDNAILNPFYDVSIFDFMRDTDKNESFNITFWDTTLTKKVLQLVFIQEHLNLTIFEFDGVNLIELGNHIVNSNPRRYISLFVDMNKDGTGNFIFESRSTILANITGLTNNVSTGFFQISIADNTDIFQKEFTYAGTIIAPVFSEIPPIGFNVTGFGTFIFGLTVSDSANQPSIFKTITTSGSVIRCGSYPTGDISVTTQSGLNSLQQITKTFCSNAQILNVAFEPQVNFCTLLNWLYIILGFIIAIIFTLMFSRFAGYMGIPMGFIILSLIYAFGTQVLEFGNGYKITTMFLFAIGCATLGLSIIFGSGFGGDKSG